MSVSVNNRRTRMRSALAAVLTVLILLPAGILFARVWSDVSELDDSTRLEQKGAEYITALSPLVSALAEAQTSSLSGVKATPGSLTAAIAGVNAVDQRLGTDLGTRDRWTGLKQKIDLLSKETGSPAAAFDAHVEVTELALALYEAVRDNSGLLHDPDNDILHLADAVAIDLPATVVQVSRMGDLSQLVAKATGQQRDQLGAKFAASVSAVETSVGGLTDNLQEAVDDTNSATLSGNLVTGLDNFRRGVESFIRGANLGGTPNVATMATAQSQLQISLGSLAGIINREMSRLLEDRLDNLAYRTLEALVAAGAAVLLAVAAIVVPLTTRRRSAHAGVRTPGEAARDMTMGAHGGEPDRPVPAYGEATSSRRERSGALR
ncbi:hypothetical protein [Couchioplanes caeruleus]|uniref:Uncharacterized protein n=2 Tax=Couchioplanes caeruleus TaxID=56438 RepID=A0A1K0GG29_9ACTN|nr:hypothetical protein [Couchioplanes caeruleus]OJF09804.1 hypothetical protein BG844_35640 [Couchioplanes caeruleus subsp. caeruleus]ROP31415.1 hypothetical protein EDD30_4315 [Couchioplanes caeruleus]